MRWIAIMMLAGVCWMAQHTFTAIDPNNVFTGTKSFQGATVASLNTIQYADQQPGEDCGAKINAADRLLGANGGEIWLNQNCGMGWITPVILHHTLRCIQGGAYKTSAVITVSGSNAGIVGSPTALPAVNDSQCTIQAATHAALAQVLVLSGSGAFLHDMTIDGNKTNTGATLGVLISGQRADLQNVQVVNAISHGFEITPTSGVDTFAKVMSYNNGGDGLYCVGPMADLRIEQSQWQSNGQNGIELNNCSTVEIGGVGDISGNALDGLKAGGVATSGSNHGIIESQNISQNEQNDLELIGTDGSGGCLAAYGWTISGNQFDGNPKTPNNTWDNIKLTDDCYENIAGNLLNSTTPGQAYKYGIENRETVAGVAHDNHIGDNTFTGFYGTSYTVNSSINPVATVFPNSFSLSFYDNAQSATTFAQLSTANTFYLFGHPTVREIQIQPQPGTTTLDLKATDTTLNLGVSGDGSGFKHKRGIPGCATAVTAGASCATSFSWTTSFADANYTVSCMGDGVTSGTPLNGGITSKSARAVTFQTVAGTAATAQYASIECIAAHD